LLELLTMSTMYVGATLRLRAAVAHHFGFLTQTMRSWAAVLKVYGPVPTPFMLRFLRMSALLNGVQILALTIGEL